MRSPITAGAACVLALVFAGAPARAAALYEGPWCAYVNLGEDSTVAKCDMRTFEMCLAEIRGNGGSCGPNPRYRGPEPRRGKPRTPQR